MKGGYQNSLEGIYWHHSECNIRKGQQVTKKEKNPQLLLFATLIYIKVWLSWWVSQTDCYMTATNHRFPVIHQCPIRKALLQRTKTSFGEIEAKSESKTTKTGKQNNQLQETSWGKKSDKFVRPCQVLVSILFCMYITSML